MGGSKGVVLDSRCSVVGSVWQSCAPRLGMSRVFHESPKALRPMHLSKVNPGHGNVVVRFTNCTAANCHSSGVVCCPPLISCLCPNNGSLNVCLLRRIFLACVLYICVLACTLSSLVNSSRQYFPCGFPASLAAIRCPGETYCLRCI